VHPPERCARVNLLRSVQGDALWPDFTEDALLADLEDWLGPYLEPVNLVKDFARLKLREILKARLDWQAQQQLDQLAPPRLRVPSGSSLTIDYLQNPPVLRVKLQEMFGCTQTPTIAEGQVELLIHLLSPAGRPLQVTQDLAGFWSNMYHEVKKDMKGRYPKHPWPDDPINAEATRRTRSRK
jgi:ATP-dependent helicase HrpB